MLYKLHNNLYLAANNSSAGSSNELINTVRTCQRCQGSRVLVPSQVPRFHSHLALVIGNIDPQTSGDFLPRNPPPPSSIPPPPPTHTFSKGLFINKYYPHTYKSTSKKDKKKKKKYLKGAPGTSVCWLIPTTNAHTHAHTHTPLKTTFS